MTTMDGPGDPMSDTARMLRLRLFEEFRSEAEAAERDARALALRSRTMGHIAHECMARGRHVAVTVGSTTVTGPVRHARGDLALIRMDPERHAYIHLTTPLVMRVLDTTSPGRSRDPVAPPSFTAALRTLEMRRAEVQVLPVAASPLRGAVAAVTPDHLALESADGNVHVPLIGIGALVANHARQAPRTAFPNFPSPEVS